MSNPVETEVRGSINYIGYGSLTTPVARVLLDRHLPIRQVEVRGYEIRQITADYMTEAERIIMGGASRYAAYENQEKAIRAWVFGGLSENEVEYLKTFDISHPDKYAVREVAYKRQGEVGQGLMVVRLTEGLRGITVRDPLNYPPYRPFDSINSRRGRELAKGLARMLRQETLERLNSA